MTFLLRSDAFDDGAGIPRHFSREGEDASPALAWEDTPPGTKELALVCYDPDAPGETPWVHWLLYKIPPTTTELPENLPKTDAPGLDGAAQGRNSWGLVGYGGPMPPPGHGPHHYNFALFALDQPVELEAGATLPQLRKAIADHVIAEAKLVGMYER